ncbi:MAG: hypothetical protein KatS3mg131_3795 [Candidatus Tectimicrobiota bacterium]|nr:MAG: hypothetical protein KatS3mg131_3795 [Candidatus Tectomicrobia bacterium]
MLDSNGAPHRAHLSEAPAGRGPIAILEPHYDDAWVNLGGTMLLRPQQRFRIVSVAEDAKNRHNRTQTLPQYVPHVETVALRLRGIPWSFRGSLEEAVRLFCAQNRLSSLAALAERLWPYVADCEEVWLPMGLEHPQHAIVAQLLPIGGKRFAYYREFPYFFPSRIRDFRRFDVGFRYKLAHARQLWRRLHGYRAEYVDVRRVREQKWHIFTLVYPEQASLLALRRSRVGALALQDEALFRPCGGRVSRLRRWGAIVLFEFIRGGTCRVF